MTTPQAGDNSHGQLKSLVQRIESINEEIRERQSDRKDIYTEAKSAGFDCAALRAVVARRQKERDDRAKLENLEQMVETYSEALG